MKVTKTLKVNAKDFYDYLLHQIRLDIEKATKQNHLTFEQLDGFQYSRFIKRKKGNPLELKIKVGPLIENRYYELSYNTPSAHNTYFYDIKPLSNDEIQVTYEEHNTANTYMNNWIYKTRIRFKEKNLEQRISQTLTQIESYILKSKSS